MLPVNIACEYKWGPMNSTNSETLNPCSVPQIFLEIPKECLTYNPEPIHQFNQHLTLTHTSPRFFLVNVLYLYSCKKERPHANK